MRKFLSAAILAALILGGAGCSLFGGPTIKPITLNYWRADDASETLDPVIAAYEKLHSNVTVVVKSIPQDKYEEELTLALAEDRGPDIMSIPNVWLRGWKDRLIPIPTETVIPTQTVNANKQVVVANVKTPGLTQRRLIAEYVEVVPGDVVMPYQAKPDAKAEDRIFGLPFSVDTMGLYYNRDLLKKASIEKPPETWREFLDQVMRLTVREDSTIKQSAAPIGLSGNIARAPEQLLTLMMQFGADMTNKNGPSFAGNVPNNRYERRPATEALLFLQRFARPGDDAYTWNAAMPESLDAFVSGKTAFYFGYPNELLTIRARAPKLDVGVSSMPQEWPDSPGNIALYPVETVSKKTKNPDVAWDFVQFSASANYAKPEDSPVMSYLQATNRPTALRGLISLQQTNPEVGPFAKQLLTARNWYYGKDYTKAHDILAGLVEVRPDYELRETHESAIDAAASEVSDTWR